MQSAIKMADIVTEAGKLMMSACDIENNMSEKTGTANFVTSYDIDIQNFLFGRLSSLYPQAEFIGEESVENHPEPINDGLCFIIDPIDGTTNFIHSYRHSAISVGLCYNGAVIAGVIYNPYLDEIFLAESGKGAYLGKRRIHVSQRHLCDGLVSFGTSPYRRDLADASFDIIKKLYLSSRDIRRSGSAALDLCYIACGRSDLFFEMTLSPWDYSAGSLIVSEAGGIITSLDGKPLVLNRPSSVIAGNKYSYTDFFNL
jgi:myo-inositol-1(or 4)-monophosphatase